MHFDEIWVQRFCGRFPISVEMDRQAMEYATVTSLLVQLIPLLMAAIVSLIPVMTDGQLSSLAVSLEEALCNRGLSTRSQSSTTAGPPGISPTALPTMPPAANQPNSEVHESGQLICRQCGVRWCAKKTLPHHVSRCYCTICHQARRG